MSAVASRPLRRFNPQTLVAMAVVNSAIVVVLGIGRRDSAALLAIALLPTAGYLGWALIQRPQRGLLVLAALLPFHGLTEITPVPSAWKEALTLVLVGAALVSPPSARARRGRSLPRWTFVLAAFAALQFVSAVIVGGDQAVVGLKIGLFFVLIAFVAWRCPLDERERDHLVTILMVTGFITAVIGLAQQVAGGQRLVDLGYEWNRTVRTSGGYLRSFSTFALSFPFSLFMMLVLLIGVPVALDDRRRLRNRLFLLSTPVLLAGLLSSITRAGWLGLLVGTVYLGVTRYRPLVTGLAHAAAASVILVIIFAGFSATFLSSGSTQERLEVWQDNVGEIAHHPFGLGIGKTGSAAEKVATLDDNSYTAYSNAIRTTLVPDNYYFKTALEYGVIGLWIFVLLMTSGFASAHMASKRLRGFDAALASGVAANILGVAAVCIIATYFEVFPLDAFFWLFLMVVSATMASAEPSREVPADQTGIPISL